MVKKVKLVKGKRKRKGHRRMPKMALTKMLVGGFPERYVTKLRCVGTYDTGAAGFNATPVLYTYFLANGILTPDGVGNCSGAASLIGSFNAAGGSKASYLHSLVLASRITIRGETIAAGASSGVEYTLGVLPYGYSSNYTGGFNNLIEQPGFNKPKLLPILSSGYQPSYMKSSVNLPVHLGLTRNQYIANAGSTGLTVGGIYNGNYNTNPTNVYQYILAVHTLSNGNDATYRCQFYYEMEFDVMFMNRQISTINAPS